MNISRHFLICYSEKYRDLDRGSMEDEALGIDSSSIKATFRMNIEIGSFSDKVEFMKSNSSRKMLKQLPEG